MGNYQDTKRRFQKNDRGNNNKSTGLKVDIPLLFVDDYYSFTTKGIRFDIESIDNLLSSLNEVNAFKKISHPVNMKKTDVFPDNENARGNISVGYIRGITKNGDISVIINQKYIDAFKSIEEPVIQVAGFVKDEKILTVLSFNIGEYEDLYNSYSDNTDTNEDNNFDTNDKDTDDFKEEE